MEMPQEFKDKLDEIATRYDIQWTKDIKDKLIEAAKMKGGILTIRDIEMLLGGVIELMEKYQHDSMMEKMSNGK